MVLHHFSYFCSIMNNMKKWVVRAKKADFKAISEKYGISEICARLIRNRDIISDEEIDYFLNAVISDMHDPFLLKDMNKACLYIMDAIKDGKSIRVVGDYDIDGVCASTILLRGLSALGAKVSYRLPHRVKDGYGLNNTIIDEAAADDIDMIVTCDNGIAAINEIAHARELGIDVIVTDHHEIPFEIIDGEKNYIMPEALCAVNPHRIDDKYPYKNICGAMVAYKLILALKKCIPDKITEELSDMLFDFAAFATIGDIMPLLNENRIAVKYGLRSMRNTKNIGLSALIDVTEVKRDRLSPYHIGFVLGPCVNAAGRLDTADTALELFMTEDKERARKLAIKLKETNDERKRLTNEKVEEAIRLVESGSDGHDYSKDTVLLVYMTDTHESIAGLIASKLKEKFTKPIIVFTDSEGCLKGSGRSIEAYDIFAELSKYKDLMIKFGGHPMACGMSIEKRNFEELRRIVNENSPIKDADLVEKYYIDIDMPINYVDEELLREIELLAPFGEANSSPLFAQKNLMVLSRKKNAKGNMVTLQLKSPPHGNRPEKTMFATMFGEADEILSKISGKDMITLAYVPEYNDFYNRVQINIKDII